MKHTLLFFIGLFLCFSAVGQDFTFEYVEGDENIVFQLSDQAGQDVVIKGLVRNTSTEEITLTWIRSVDHITDSWQTAVCDRNQCYLPWVSTQTVDIPASDSSNMDVHLYPDRIAGDSAIVELALV